MNNELLTVDEVAEILRTTPNTIYRWLRAGKFPGVKIGKEWRIKRETLTSRLNDTNRQVELSYLDQLNSQGDHVMVLTSNSSEAYDLEAEFYKKGLGKGNRLFKGCWGQEQDEVRNELTARGIPVNELERENLLVIANLTDPFKENGIQGPIDIWTKEAQNSVALGYEAMWGSGSPDLLYRNDFPKLKEFEYSLDKSLEKLPVVGICPYVFKTETRDDFNSFVYLMNYHKGVLFYGSGPAAFFRAGQ